MPPWEWRAGQRLDPEPEPETTGDCLIKGNVNSEGERIYHSPGSRYYDKTNINRPGERWFCTEAEAESAGWRAPYR